MPFWVKCVGSVMCSHPVVPPRTNFHSLLYMSGTCVLPSTPFLWPNPSRLWMAPGIYPDLFKALEEKWAPAWAIQCCQVVGFVMSKVIFCFAFYVFPRSSLNMTVKCWFNFFGYPHRSLGDHRCEVLVGVCFSCPHILFCLCCECKELSWVCGKITFLNETSCISSPNIFFQSTLQIMFKE